MIPASEAHRAVESIAKCECGERRWLKGRWCGIGIIFCAACGKKR